MQCPGCGAENMDGASTCWECGSSMAPSSDRPGRAWLLWVFVGLAGLAVVGIALSANSGPGQSTGTVDVTGTPGVAGSSQTTPSQDASPAL